MNPAARRALVFQKNLHQPFFADGDCIAALSGINRRMGIRWFFLALILGFTAHAAPIEGVWGGKWDDQWPVFITVKPGAESGAYSVQYTWLENTGDGDFSRRDIEGRTSGQHIRAGFLFFKIDGQTGMLYGAFKRPRMANLVKLDAIPPVTEASAALREAGWKPGSLPANEAFKAITGEEPGD